MTLHRPQHRVYFLLCQMIHRLSACGGWGLVEAFVHPTIPLAAQVTLALGG